MKRQIFIYALMITAAAALGAQEPGQASPYEGTSNPPSDDAIVTSSEPQAKPPAGRRAAPAQEPVQQPQAQPSSQDPSVNYPDLGSDDGMVQPQHPKYAQPSPSLSARANAYDPDGDIVHPRPLRTGELAEGTTIRVRLLHRLSTATSEKGEAFRSRVATDVMQGDRVVIPAGAEIDGKVIQVSTGRTGGHGTMRLQPDLVILPNGTRYRLSAELTGAPGSRTKIGGEGTVRPDSRLKRNGIEYGGAVGAGAVTGAFLGGPVGALTGSLIGAGVVTAHLLVSHPQATLETGTTLLFTLTEPLNLVAAGRSGD